MLKLNGIMKKIKTRIMERARDARYENIINLCKKMKIIHLMTAHNLEDNLETYLMRKKKKQLVSWTIINTKN